MAEIPDLDPQPKFLIRHDCRQRSRRDPEAHEIGMVVALAKGVGLDRLTKSWRSTWGRVQAGKRRRATSAAFSFVRLGASSLANQERRKTSHFPASNNLVS